MRTVKIGSLVFDFDLYPRTDVDSQHVHYIREAIEAGEQMPALVVERKTMRIVDGFHRAKAYLSLYGPDHEVDVVEKTYRSEADLLEDAIRYNARHGRTLTRCDRARCAILAERHGLSIDRAAQAMGLTVETVTKLRAERVGKLRVYHGGTPKRGKRGKPIEIPIKRTIKHMAGKELTPEQAEANKRLSGMEQLFYVNQLILLIENDLLDRSNEKLLAGLARLRELLDGVVEVNAA